MTEKSVWETVKGDGQVILERLKTLIHEGNIRRVVVKHQGRSIAEFPLTAGVVGVLLAPVVAAVGTIIAMLKDKDLGIALQFTNYRSV